MLMLNGDLKVLDTVLGGAGLVAAFAVPFTIEALKRPRLAIDSGIWAPGGVVLWTFAVVRVRNKLLPWRLDKVLSREVAQACKVHVDFYRWDETSRLFQPLPGRWSSHPEPIRLAQGPAISAGMPVSGVPAGNPATQGAARVIYDPSLDSQDQDVAVSVEGEEVAVAILRYDGEAYAFSNGSYAHELFGNPAWLLPRGTYRIDVRVQGSNTGEYLRSFKLEFLSSNFADFKLQTG